MVVEKTTKNKGGAGKRVGGKGTRSTSKKKKQNRLGLHHDPHHHDHAHLHGQFGTTQFSPDVELWRCVEIVSGY